MNHKFPIIRHINDVLPAIKGRDEFVVAERGDHTIINYLVAFDDTFSIDEDDRMDNHGVSIPKGIMRRECRGLIFDDNGKIMSRPFDKWFNINERIETQTTNLDFSSVNAILTKLDGSMVRPLNLRGKIHWGTKMGLTDVGQQVDIFVKNHPKYDLFAKWSIDNDLTPIFEWCSSENRIVIRYEKDALTLLAVRKNITGEYINLH